MDNATPNKDEEAFRLIDEFSKQLKKISGKDPIPRRWRNRLAKTLMPKQAGRGVKRDPKRTAQIIDLLVENEKALSKERTKHNSPAAIKERIAQKVGISAKTVERVYELLNGASKSIADKTIGESDLLCITTWIADDFSRNDVESSQDQNTTQHKDA
jgi:hypothetical protein